MRKIFIKHNLLWILMISILLMSISTFFIGLTTFLSSKRNNHLFVADSHEVHYPGLNAKSFKNHAFQSYFEELIAKKLRMRNFFIKINSQIYYSFFKKSFAEENSVIIGKHQQLFETPYISAYCFAANNNVPQLSAWAEQVKKLAHYFQTRGKIFIYLITPSKAEYMPQAIPNRFSCTNRGLSNNVKKMAELLRERDIPYINGPEIMIEGKKKYGIEMFPPGGIHWNQLGSTLAANAIINTINAIQPTNLLPLKFNIILGGIDHLYAEDDLLSLIKLLRPNRNYLVPKLEFINKPLSIPLMKILCSLK